MTDLLAWISIILSVASTTLAITAIIIGWVTYRNSSKMQIDSHIVLNQVSQKVDVINERTSHQLDRAWEYFTRSSVDSKEQLDSKTKNEIKELRNQIIEDARHEFANAAKKIGLEQEALQSLVKEIQEVVGKSTERSTRISDIEIIAQNYDQIDRLIRNYSRNLGVKDYDRMSLIELINIHSAQKNINFPPALIADLDRLRDVRNIILHEKPDRIDIDLKNYVKLSDQIYDFLRRILRREPGTG